MGKFRYIVIGDGLGESSIDFFPPSNYFRIFLFCAKASLLSVCYEVARCTPFFVARMVNMT